MFLFQLIGPIRKLTKEEMEQLTASPSKPPAAFKIDAKEITVTPENNPALTIQKELNKILQDPKNVGKTVVAYFWADNCVPCKGFTPKLEKLVSSLDKDKTVYVKINLSQIYNNDDNQPTISALRHVGEFSAIPLTLVYKPWPRDIDAIKQFNSKMAADEEAYQQKLAESKKKKDSLPPVKPADVKPELLSRSAVKSSAYLSGAHDTDLTALLTP